MSSEMRKMRKNTSNGHQCPTIELLEVQNMDQTTVMVEFSIYGEDFDPNYITEQLDVIPTETYLKGEPIKNRNRLVRKETSWSISTGYEPSYDINEQLGKIMFSLENKMDKLVELNNNHLLKMLFMIVIKIENNEIPAMYFRKDFIQFASNINAEIGFDPYIYS